MPSWSSSSATRTIGTSASLARSCRNEPPPAARWQKSTPNLRKLFADDPDPVHKLRALWCLYVTGGAPEPWLLSQLAHRTKAFASGPVRLLGDGKTPSAAAVRAFSALAPHERSGLVLLYLASALQELPPADRWSLAEGLAARADFAGDRVLPLMIWYGIEPAVPEDPLRAVRLVESSPMLPLVRCVARRLTENLKLVPQPVERLVTLAGQPESHGANASDSHRNGRGTARLAESADAGDRGSRHKKQDSSRVPIPKSAGSPASCRSSSATAGP